MFPGIINNSFIYLISWFILSSETHYFPHSVSNVGRLSPHLFSITLQFPYLSFNLHKMKRWREVATLGRLGAGAGPGEVIQFTKINRMPYEAWSCNFIFSMREEPQKEGRYLLQETLMLKVPFIIPSPHTWGLTCCNFIHYISPLLKITSFKDSLKENAFSKLSSCL